MSKNLKGMRQEPGVISLPLSVAQVLAPIPARNANVSHAIFPKPKSSVVIPDTPILTSENHAFFIGNYFPLSIGERVKLVLGCGELEKRLYSEEFIAGCLDYQFQHIAPGQKAYFAVGGEVGFLMNGSENTDGAFSVDQTIELIYGIARRKFSKDSNHLEVIDLSKSPLHGDLFAALGGSLIASPNTQSKVVDIEKALGGALLEFGENPSSLQIARCLYEATKASAVFLNIIKNCLPEHLQNNQDANTAKLYYAIIEIAIRLKEILQGRFIHGGAARQGKYDEIISKIITGKYSKISSLEGLMKIFQGKRFETLHLDTQKNYYQQKSVRIRAAARLAVITALAGSVIGGAYATGRQHEQQEHARRAKLVENKLDDQLKDTTFYWDGRWPIDKKNNVNHLLNIVKEMKEQLALRYQLNSKIQDELEPFLLEFLLRDKANLNSFDWTHASLIDAVDLFVKEKVIYFKSRGVEVTKPYNHLFPYIKTFQQALKSNGNFTVEAKSSQLRKLAEFKPSSEDRWWRRYGLALYNNENGQTYIVACDHSTHLAEEHVYTAKDGREIGQEFLNSIRRYDALILQAYAKEGLLLGLIDPNSIHYSKENYVLAPQDFWCQEPVRYTDSLGEFDYELCVYYHYDPQSKQTSKNLLARLPSESNYTTARAIEVASLYLKVQKLSWRGGQ